MLLDRVLRRLRLARLVVVQREIADLAAELNEARALLVKARDQQADAKRALAEAKSHSRAERDRAKALGTALAAAKTDIKSSRDEVKAIRDELRRVRAVVGSTRDERTAAQRELVTARTRARETLERAKALVGELSTARTEIKARRDEVRSLRQELRRVRAIIGAPRDELRALLPVRAAAALTRHDPESAVLAARFAELSPAYAEAQDAWQRGDRPLLRQRTIAGMQFSIPEDGGAEGSLSFRLAHGWLPLDDIIRVRPLAVGGVMLDIGGNIGTTCIPRVVFGDFARAYAAEPEHDNYRCLVGNVLDNGLAGRLLPDRVAISSSNGTARLRRTTRIGGHSLLAMGQQWAGQVDDVPCLTIDTWLAKLGVAPESVGFVKVDTQGWDPHALAGAPGLLARREVVWQIEVSPPLMAKAGYSVADLAALVAQHFTHIKELDPTDGRGLRPATEVIELLNAIEGRKRFTNLILLNATAPDA